MSESKGSGKERKWRRLTVEMYMTDDEYRRWNIESTNPQVRIVDYDEIDDRREAFVGTRISNGPRHGPLKLLRLGWRMLRSRHTGSSHGGADGD